MADASPSRRGVGTVPAPVAPVVPSPTAVLDGDAGSLTFQVLGPLRVWRDGVELDTGPRQQTYLLALLLIRAGRPVSTSELIDLIWDDEMPTSALNIVQKYVGSLRRLLEPNLPARAPGHYIHRRSSGYQFDESHVALDLTEFRQLLGLARAALDVDQIEEGVSAYEEALSRWRGSAGDGLALSATAGPAVRLRQPRAARRLCRGRSGRRASRTGATHPATATPGRLDRAPRRDRSGDAHDHPGGVGQQAEALSVFDRGRAGWPTSWASIPVQRCARRTDRFFDRPGRADPHVPRSLLPEVAPGSRSGARPRPERGPSG